MYIIDESYFIKELNIPNTVETDVSGAATPFEMWIDKEVRLCLQKALGSVLFSDLDSNITDGVYQAGVTKWDNLVNGTSYTYNGDTYIWKGLIYTEGTFKGSLLAYYVYCKWLEYQLSHQSGMGEVRGEAVNSMSANSTYRYVNVWNMFVELYQGKSSTSSTLTYIKGVPFYDYFGNNESDYVSLIEFLQHNEADYPDAPLKCYNYLNTFGL